MDEELYIRMLNGRPVDHPMLRSNVETAFPDVDFDNLPDWLARFERVQKPRSGIYEIVNGPVYVIDGNLVRDQWILRPMTEDEKLIKQNRVRQSFSNSTNGQPSSWIFDEELCQFVPPVPYPDDGAGYQWSEPAQAWVAVAAPVVADTIEGPGGVVRKPYPRVGGQWRWDEATEDWIKISDDPPVEGTLNVPLPPGITPP